MVVYIPNLIMICLSQLKLLVWSLLYICPIHTFRKLLLLYPPLVNTSMVTDISCIPIGCFWEGSLVIWQAGLELKFSVSCFNAQGISSTSNGAGGHEERGGWREEERGGSWEWREGGGLRKRRRRGEEETTRSVTHAHTHAEAYPGLYSMTVERFSQDLDRSDMDKLRLVRRPL